MRNRKALYPRHTWVSLDLIGVGVEPNAALHSFGPFIVDSGVPYYMCNTISCFDFRKSLSPNQPSARMHLLTGQGPESDDQFGVALVQILLRVRVSFEFACISIDCAVLAWKQNVGILNV